MTTRSFIGSTIYVAVGAPATNNAAGFEALTWVKVNGLVTGPGFGVTHATVEIPDLETGFGRGVKGMGQGMESQMTFREIEADPGQLAIRGLANAGGGVGSLRINFEGVAPGSPVEYAQGFFHSAQGNPVTGENYSGFSITFRQNQASVIDDMPT
jgi:hypothetical protein